MAEVEIDVAKLNEAVREEARLVQTAMDEVRKVIVGQRTLVERMMVALLCRGHLLVEGVPGSREDDGGQDAGAGAGPAASRASSSRRTCCPPTSSARSSSTRSRASSWPARDRSSRTCCWPTRSTARPPKVQSALLESMQERQVTLGDATHPLPDPVPGLRDAESDRAGRHLPAARGAGRPLPAEGQGRLSDEGRGAPGARPDDLGRGAGRLQGALGRRRAPSRGPRARGVHGRAPARLHGGARLRDAHPARGGPRRPGPAHRLRRLSARDARLLRGVPRRRLPARPRLRRPRGRQGDRQGRAPPPRSADVRGRSRERHERHGRRANPGASRSPVEVSTAKRSARSAASRSGPR